MDALECNTRGKMDYITNSLIEGIHLFKEIWEFKPKSSSHLVILDSEIESILMNEGIRFLQGIFNNTNLQIVTIKYLIKNIILPDSQIIQVNCIWSVMQCSNQAPGNTQIQSVVV